VQKTFGIGRTESVLSYLPLSHIAEQIVSLHGPMAGGACSWFAESLEKLGENLREVRPHFFFGVPRVWEKIQAGIEAAGAQNPPLKKKIAAWARRQGLAGGYAHQRGEDKPALYGLADKLLIITSGGKNVAPQLVEAQLKAIRGVALAAVIGDRRNYLSAILTLDPDAVHHQAAILGSPAEDAEEAAKCPVFRKFLEFEVEKVNEKLASFESIKRFIVLPEPFSIEGGELTPTMKLKRRVVNEKYARQIEELYATSNPDSPPG